MLLMVNLSPFNNPLVPFVVEYISQLNENNDFSICTKVNGVGPSVTFKLPQNKTKICNMIKNHRQNYPKKLLKDLRYFDLLFDEEYCNGIYIFFEGDDCSYVGSSASRCIVERVGGHMCLRQKDFLNSMVKYLALRNKGRCGSVKSVTSADLTNTYVLQALSEMSLLFIPVKHPKPCDKQMLQVFKQQVERLEDFFIFLCQPNLQMGTNSRNGKYNQVRKKYNW